MTTNQDAMEAAARALIERQIRVNRKWDTPPDELEALLPGAIDYAWRERLEDAEIAVQAFLAAREAEGVVLAPLEPTQDMIDAGWRHAGFPAVQGYRAMTAARPTNGDR